MSGDNGFGQITEKDVKAMIEKDYNSESLRFIYDHINDFEPVLTKIVPYLSENKYIMETANKSNLQNLIVKLTEYTIIKGKKGEKNKKKNC